MPDARFLDFRPEPADAHIHSAPRAKHGKTVYNTTMAEQQGHLDGVTRGSAAPDRELPLDTKLLSDAVIELNISRKNVGIYPPGHIQITNSIDRAYHILLKLFDIRPEMTLGVAKDTLLVGKNYLDQKNPVYRDFALSLNQQGIAAVTFAQGLDREELVRFHRVLTTKPEDIRAAGGVASVVGEALIPHIRIQAIDYGSFSVTEEREIAKTDTGQHARQGVWQDFVSQLVDGTLAGGGQGVALQDLAVVDPAALARLLNERRMDARAAQKSYENIIASYVRGVAEHKRPTKEQSETLRKLNDLVKGLHPELRRQFLSAAFQQVSSGPGPAEELVGGLPDDMVIEMVQAASDEGRQISPTLSGLIQKLSSVAGPTPAGQGPAAGPDRDQPEILPEHMKKLFDREGYENYVTSDYDAVLKELSDPNAAVAAAVDTSFPVAEHAASLTDEHLDFQIGRALIAFMEEDIEEEDYREFSRKLAAVMPHLLSSGNFVLVLDILETLRSHSREKAVPGIRALAAETLAVFEQPSFINQSVDAFDTWARTKGREAAGLLLALGPACVPGLLDVFARDETPGGRKILFDLLCNFGKPAVTEAQRRLRDPRAYYVRNLVMLIRWAGNQASVSAVKPLLTHQDEKVRMEALAALLRFKDTGAVGLLRESLRSKDPDVVSQALFLAGQYRVYTLVEDILSLVKKVILFETDYALNAEIIKALGEIGDPRAVPDLERLAKASWTLYPEALMKMKLTLFESLDRYPKGAVEGLLAFGEKASDERIRRACRKLAERK
jgi:hypothetical protein